MRDLWYNNYSILVSVLLVTIGFLLPFLYSVLVINILHRRHAFRKETFQSLDQILKAEKERRDSVARES